MRRSPFRHGPDLVEGCPQTLGELAGRAAALVVYEEDLRVVPHHLVLGRHDFNVVLVECLSDRCHFRLRHRKVVGRHYTVGRALPGGPKAERR